MSANQDDPLARIADALERISPPPAPVDWMAHPAYVWDGREARAIPALAAPALPLLRGVDRQKQQVVDNVQRLAAGHAAHDMLLWGARGMGKSALIRASVRAAQLGAPAGIALVQVVAEALGGLARLFGELGRQQRNFLTYIDDLGFAEDDSAGPRQLRSWLEGGVEARPANVRLAVTSNRRAIVPRHGAEQDDPINPRDAVDDRLALADRFGLSIGFHNCTQDDYLAIIAGYADEFGLEWDEGEALEWAKRRGARSGRTAWQYITEIAGRAGQTLPA
ncbi:MAG: ATP-binding protein [Novosphingobium sp.]|nr:ATP-binding protein [Novosphingobium sp.]MCP5389256.1 ATP-binding protein [Novosphingobium sp.]